MMSQDIRRICEEALKQLKSAQQVASCNDFEVPNTEEMRRLWLEFQAWNLGCDVEDLPAGSDQWEHLPAEADDATAVVHDGFALYVLRRQAGLLS